ncbi:hypothetical protein PLEOSDRAFT_32314 [Pleurotus ostreatus PC15]|uniref:HpcH/HpaI aldolase/citrate lyase domain-containing protein n=1 Tax=Pleurotus ostreatus (strain PC15) TaxID=1137138 RepID=A0A067NQM4_PLEO1|nr:hypothetical protein PLEOSDRAFT_32314 [Pleurotus ostreatus PC15]
MRLLPARSLARVRCLHSGASTASLNRSYLYVPCSSDKMLEKSLNVKSDVVIYDLEDSVPPSPADKDGARRRLKQFLQRADLPEPSRVAVRINDLSTPFFAEDVAEILASSAIQTLVLPKIHSAQDLHHVSRALVTTSLERKSPLKIIPSIELARALWNIGSIASWESEYSVARSGIVSALLFAAEDYCADTSILRSRSRRELLYTRSQIVIAARAFGLEAIDMVCVNYKDLDYLREECEDGRALGFTGKQAIHPTQVDVIQSTFVPTSHEILRAAKIVHAMKAAHASQQGAVGLEGEMIDAPMIKQAEQTLRIAAAAGLEIPTVTTD